MHVAAFKTIISEARRHVRPPILPRARARGRQTGHLDSPLLDEQRLPGVASALVIIAVSGALWFEIIRLAGKFL